MNVGAAIRINLDGTARDTNKAGTHLKSPSSEANAKDDPNDVGFAEFYNVDAVSYRRTLQLDGRGLHGLSTRQPTDAPSRWRLPPHGILTVSEPVVSLMSLPPVEEAFLVRVATLLTPLVFAPSELLPIGRMYVVHRGLALLRKRWLGVGAMWGLEMILQEEYTQQYAAAAKAAAAPMRPASPHTSSFPPSLPTQVLGACSHPCRVLLPRQGDAPHCGVVLRARGQTPASMGAHARAALLPARKLVRAALGRARAAAHAVIKRRVAERLGVDP
jgi:hypothetical protein